MSLSPPLVFLMCKKTLLPHHAITPSFPHHHLAISLMEDNFSHCLRKFFLHFSLLSLCVVSFSLSLLLLYQPPTYLISLFSLSIYLSPSHTHTVSLLPPSFYFCFLLSHFSYSIFSSHFLSKAWEK